MPLPALRPDIPWYAIPADPRHTWFTGPVQSHQTPTETIELRG